MTPPTMSGDTGREKPEQLTPTERMLEELREMVIARDKAADEEARARKNNPLGGPLPLVIQTFGPAALGLVMVIMIWQMVFQPMLERDRESNKALIEVAAAVVRLADAINSDREQRKWDTFTRPQPSGTLAP